MAAPDTPLVPGRECGTCNACCVALTIRDPALNKLPGVRCPNNQDDGRCGIYHDRPDTCRTYFCGWRRLPWVKAAMRPDQSHVLVSLRTYKGVQGVAFMVLDEAGVSAEGFAESIAAGVAARVPVFFVVPGPPGYTAGIAQVNDAFEDVVRARDKPQMLVLLRQAWQGGQGGDRQKVVLDAS